jgi:hypothetical protein
MMPMYFMQGYLSFTVFAFAEGPWPWPVKDAPLLYLHLFAYQVALWLGYRLGLRGRKGSCEVGAWTSRNW